MSSPYDAPGSQIATSNIWIEGCDDGDTFPLFGTGGGTSGLCLMRGGLEDLYEAPIRTVERTPQRMDGGILRAVKTAIMEPVVSVFVKKDHLNAFEIVDGQFREAFSYELDPYNPNSKLARIVWQTEESTRWIEVVIAEGTSWQANEVVTVPQLAGYYEVELHLKAYMPFWQEDDLITPIEFLTDGSKTVEIENPTGVDMAPKWVGAPATYTIPDNTWEGPAWNRAPGGLFPTRTVTYPDLDAVTNGGIRIDLDPMSIPVRDAYDTNLVGLMPVPGDYPKHLIPRHTQKQNLTVSATNVPEEGAMLILRQPRRYRRPWGRI